MSWGLDLPMEGRSRGYVGRGRSAASVWFLFTIYVRSTSMRCVNLDVGHPGKGRLRDSTAFAD